MNLSPNPMELKGIIYQISSLQNRLQSESEDILKIRNRIGEILGGIQSEGVSSYMQLMETTAQDINELALFVNG